jgi:cbb3-type cytochrome oxidase maturation protein
MIPQETDPTMNSPMEGTTFLFVWLGFLMLMIFCVGFFFLWAVRSGQFSNQDRARYLPLQSGIPHTGDPNTGSRQEIERRPS